MADSNNRYARQQLVAKLGNDSQVMFANAHVLIIGAGGLGSPLSLFLAGAGVGKITLVDDDVVSVSNLHRQILFQENDIDRLKVEAAKNRLHKLNGSIEIITVAQRLTIKNADSLISQATVVVDAADNFLVSYLLSDLCFAKRIPLVSASVLTTHGYLGVYCGTNEKPAPSLRAVFPAPSSDVNNCNTAGVTGPSVGVIGSYQAQEVLKVILNSDAQLLGKLMTLDLWDYRQHIIDFNQSSEPTAQAPIISLDSIPSDELILDVRSNAEHNAEPLSRPVTNIPLNELIDRINELDLQQTTHCICKSGQRALNAAQQLIDHGFKNVKVTSQ